MHACTPTSRRSWSGCPLLRSFYQWPCTFTKHTIQTHTCTHTQFQEVMARLPADEFFMLVALPPAALSRQLLQLEGTVCVL